MEVPRLEKIVLNIGMGEAIDNAKSLEIAQTDLANIAGQHPVITRAKKSISAFKLRVEVSFSEPFVPCLWRQRKLSSGKR